MLNRWQRKQNSAFIQSHCTPYCPSQLPHRHDVASFSAVTLDGSSPERPFANSLTGTHHDFANYIHRDKDWSPLVFGSWWAAEVDDTGSSTMFRFADDAEHNKITGGAFLLAEYGVAVNFEKYIYITVSRYTAYLSCPERAVSLTFSGEVAWTGTSLFRATAPPVTLASGPAFNLQAKVLLPSNDSGHWDHHPIRPSHLSTALR